MHQSLSFLEGLDVAFRAQPIALTAYGEGDDRVARYRFFVEAHPNNHRERGIRGVLTMVARREKGISFAWEEVRWNDGTPLSEPESWEALALLLRHMAAQLLYQHTYFALKAGDIQVAEERFDA